MLTITRMRKKDAIARFEGVPALAKALKITRQAIYQWPDKLDLERTDRVNGALLRLGKLRLSDLKQKELL